MNGLSRLLIVDDSPTVLSLLQLVFEGDNYEVATARDGMEGLEKVRHWKPDLIVTDSVMPNLDGFELLRILRSDPSTSEIPVIILTGSEQADHPRGADLAARRVSLQVSGLGGTPCARKGCASLLVRS